MEKQKFEIIQAQEKDTPLVLNFIKELAEYEHLLDKVKATEEILYESLFGEHKVAECIIAYEEDIAVSFALFFYNFSTFLGKKGIYLEDLFVKPEYRGKGYGKALLKYLAKLAKRKNCGRLEWWVLDWNKPSIEFYNSLGAKPMDEWTVFRLGDEALDKLAE